MESAQNRPEPTDRIRMYTTNWCPDCWRAKQVMQSMQVAYEEININENEDAVDIVLQLNNGHRSVPTIVFPDGSVLTEPSTPVLAQKLTTMIGGK
ncbi:MAG: thioredoxin family protein [Caldilineaceae bacterium]|nr:thioredoxin family protein [Caldilineaceae bacterium]